MVRLPDTRPLLRIEDYQGLQELLAGEWEFLIKEYEL